MLAPGCALSATIRPSSAGVQLRAISLIAMLPRSNAAPKMLLVRSANLAPSRPNLVCFIGMRRRAKVWKQTAVENLSEVLRDKVSSAVPVLTQLAAAVEASGYEKCVEPCSLCALDISINLIADHQKTVGTGPSDALFENRPSGLPIISAEIGGAPKGASPA